MVIKQLECRDFRNYEDLTVDFAPGINILYGDNAQGKTNILEALFVSCTSRSHRSKKDPEMIRFGQEESHIRMVTEKNGIESRVDIHLRRNKKKAIAINGVQLRRASDLLGVTHAVFFSPEDLNIIKNGPAERRRFLDMELCQISRPYLSDLNLYHKALEQRNQLLKDLADKPELLDTLDVWDQQLVNYGSRIMTERRRFIRQLDQIVGPLHEQLTGGKESLRLAYEPDTQEEEFADRLLIGREADRRLRMTQCGPHRDDLKISIGDMDVRRYGSQGQQRSAALSLKMAEIGLVRQIVGDTPVLLLDDVLSELDQSRQEALLSGIDGIQTILTCTGLDEAIRERLRADRLYEIRNAAAVRKDS